jgi:hypothetical protein
MTPLVRFNLQSEIAQSAISFYAFNFLQEAGAGGVCDLRGSGSRDYAGDRPSGD